MRKEDLQRVFAFALAVVMVFTITVFPIYDVSATIASESNNVAREIAEEGNILLKNVNNALSLSAGEKIALFGQGQRFTKQTN